MPLALELGRDDLVHVEEAVLLQSDLDERGFHTRQDVVDGAEVNVPGDRAPLRSLQVDLGNSVVFEHGDTLLADIDRDEQLPLGLRKRRAPWRLAAAALLRALTVATRRRRLPVRLRRLFFRLLCLGVSRGRARSTTTAAGTATSSLSGGGGGGGRLFRLFGGWSRYGLGYFSRSGSLGGRLLR
jgi:hypothetical protein